MTTASKAKAVLVRQLSSGFDGAGGNETAAAETIVAVSGAGVPELGVEAEPGDAFGILVRLSSTKGDDDDDDGVDGVDEEGSSSSLAKIAKHQLRQSFQEDTTSDSLEDASALESAFRRTTLSRGVQPVEPLASVIDDRLLVPRSLKRPEGPFLTLSYLRGALKSDEDKPHQLALFTTNLQCVARFLLIASAKLTRRASFAIFAGLEDSPAAVVQKARLKPTFYVARNGEVVFTIKRVTPTLLRVYEGPRIRDESCRFAVLFSPSNIVMRVVRGKATLGETVVTWSASETFAGNSMLVAAGMDALLVMACVGIAAQFAPPPSIVASRAVQEAVSHTKPPTRLRDVVQ